jgi:serine protease Do
VASLKTNGSVERGFIGVQIQPVTKDIADTMGMAEPRGALVAEAVKGGPADKAGLKRGDAIVAVEGQPIREPKDLSRRIAAFDPGKSVPLTVLRDGKERTVTIEIGRQNDRA